MQLLSLAVAIAHRHGRSHECAPSTHLGKAGLAADNLFCGEPVYREVRELLFPTAQDDNGRVGFHLGSVGRIPGLKSETWGTISVVAGAENSLSKRN